MIAESIREVGNIRSRFENPIKKKSSAANESSFTAKSAYITSLSLQLRTNESVLKNAALKSERWTKSCYDLLSRIIAENLTNTMPFEARMLMGTTISAKTLQKIVTCTYKLSNPIDPRTLNTLNKVVFFLGYKSWDSFTTIEDQASEGAAEDIALEEILMQTVREAVRREHYTYCQLPRIRNKYLTHSYIKDSPSYNQIMDVLTNKVKTKQIISNDYNPSSYEILDIDVKKIEDNYAQVSTKIYWLLCWWDALQQRYVKRYKDISDHIYILTRDRDEKWLIRTNVSTTDLMEIV